MGFKFGWWIYYTKSYNTEKQPDLLDTGEYVDVYTYGQFKNNIKIGDWKTVKNVHLISDLRVDNYYYAKDTLLIRSNYAAGGWFESTTYYNNDSSIIKYKVIYGHKGEKDICIDCNRFKKPFSQNCTMTYRGKLIKTFPHTEFENEQYKCTFMYDREKWQIDKSIQ